ncbi:MAG TPA: twin-arginine translocase TatA/TatE family subunit [Blastocatellia bacterium]|nr:twin-arginine translocase TatA/TatE family subunit [Blastocatellia bacterium]
MRLYLAHKESEVIMGLGMGEIILILVVALVVFGPRKLPELGKSMGQAMAQFRRASEDFKRTWEQEVETEKVRKSDTAGGESTYGYNESYDPYNSYSEDSNKLETSANVAESGSAPASSTQNNTETQAAAVAETTPVKAQPEKKHWI